MIIALKPVHKITLAAILLVFIIIFTRVIAIGNIEPMPFLRISLGPTLIVFTTILLGPIYGAVVSALSDILGILIFPNAYSINPLFTLVYFLFGLAIWFSFFLARKIKNEKLLFIINASFFLGLSLFITLFLTFNNEFTLLGVNYQFALWLRILIPILSFLLSGGTLLGIFFIDRHYKKKEADKSLMVNKIAFSVIISNFLCMLILNSIVKTIFFEVAFLIIFFVQALTFFIDVILTTFFVPYLLLLVSKIYKSSNQEST